MRLGFRGGRLAVVAPDQADRALEALRGTRGGAEAVIIGEQGEDAITAREMAAAIGSIPWEVVCRLGTRIPRRYPGDDDA